MAPTRRTSAHQQLKTPNTINVTHAEQATAEEHIITPVTNDHIASTSTSALHSSECRGDDRPGSFTKRAKIAWRGNLSRRSKRASAAKRKREEETEIEASLSLSSQSQRKQYVLSHETLGGRNYRLYCKSVYTYSLKSKRKLPKRLQDNKKRLCRKYFCGLHSPHRKATRNAADAAATSI
ncbi:unnamed protein product [Acanthosepion pharaonis]|uniref:Uncharacterized protein n=1 Tax=Acanthosepion pharaonis TaxID=158019 RepID=A0A812DIJ3_ACAPH|nr:unnamed protein product [Sepia pharaonis]